MNKITQKSKEKSWGVETFKKVMGESEYFKAYSVLKRYLELLEGLNNQIPSFIEKMVDSKKEQIFKQLETLKNDVNDFNKFRELLDKNTRLKGLNFEIGDSQAGNLFREIMETKLFNRYIDEFIREMSLVYLIIEFESFLKKILEHTFMTFPQILSSSQKMISHEDCMGFNNIKELQQAIIEKEAADILSKDIEDIGQILGKKFKINIKEETNWNSFKECFYRRNLIVHRLGNIDDKYREKTNYTGDEQRLSVSAEYLSDSIEQFKQMGLELFVKFFFKFDKTLAEAEI